MNSKEVLEAFRAETPVRFGDLVFNRIESVNYKRAHYNQFITDESDGKCVRGRKLKIIQAICSDMSGNMYVLNPLRLEAATDDEVNVCNDVDYILTERLKLIPIFEAWCEEHSLDVTIDALLVFLFSEDLINAGKAYHTVRAFERNKTEEANNGE